MLLLGLLSAGAAPACGNIGGAFVGAHAGFLRAIVKTTVKNPLTDTQAGDLFDVFTSKATVEVKSAADFANVSEGISGDTLTIKVDGSAGDNAAAANSAYGFAKKAVADQANVAVKTVKIVVKDNATTALTAATIRNEFRAKATPDEKSAFVKDRVKNDATETKLTSNNGLVGIHAGYLHRINQMGIGALVEGNWVIGQDIKDDTNNTTIKDMKARFGLNLLARAAYFMTSKAFIGLDAGLAIQEFRQPKAVQTTTNNNKTDKESKWLWAPMARAVVGMAMTDNIVVTLTAGGAFPIKQDWFTTGIRAKYANIQGNLGVSYFFGA